MATYAAIADVSEALVERLRDQVAERSDVVSIDRSEIGVVSPGESAAEADVRLGLYLYRVTEDGSMKNVERYDPGQDTTAEPPLALELRYVLAAYPAQSGREETSKALDQQRLLGLAMQVLYDNSVLDSESLSGSGDEDANVTVSLAREPTDTFSTLWNTLTDDNLQPAALYHVGPVQIDPRAGEEIQRVTDRAAEVERLPEERRGSDPFDDA